MSDQEGIESPYNNNTITGNSKQTSDEKEENVN